MIISVNGESLLGASYEKAATVLKRAGEVVNLCIVGEVAEPKPSPPAPFSKPALPEKPKVPPKPASLSKLPLGSPPGSSSVLSDSSVSLSPSLEQRSKSDSSASLTATASASYSSLCPIEPGRETTIEINKDKMGLGLSIVGGKDTLLGSIIIHEVYPDGAAAKDGRLRPGDQILQVNFCLAL
jgi:hypothetical protein